ncbi:glycosyl hydrolase family 95 catalytic domain-containing protein [Pedobacter sp. BS3]|uniref:glycoside hydrolase family 95 protein n=1 Tax=Pedobacter sp. BS3 TaxID=2567937 RepID=UPI001F5BC394|nr:glycoside hydrolase family 95 protein [Pedobacter sp. BS3]
MSKDKHLKLWYDTPAGDTWEAALPVGNGRLAAMVFGNPINEVLQLNESSVWSGGPNRNDNPNALKVLPQIRKLIFEGRYKEANDLAVKNIQSERINGMCYQPVGELHLDFMGHQQYRNYYRELDMETAETRTSYMVNGVTFTRSVFASVPAQVIVMHLTASKPGSITFNAALSSLQRSDVAVDSVNQLILSGISGDRDGVPGQVKFKSLVRFKTKGGQVTASGKTVHITGADAVTLYISIATNVVRYNDISASETEQAEKYLERAWNISYNELIKAHIASYRYYFNRVKLDLGTTKATKQPTDVRLSAFANGDDPQLATLYFQFGRYLLISSSQPGGQPANLQGIWNNRMDPPWGSKYTININTEMNYWPAEVTSLPEMHEPLVQMVRELSETGAETARVMYGARGWVAHHNTDLWRITGPVDGIYWGMWPMGGVWLSRHLWDKYLYNGDKNYLQSVYPVLKDAARFCLDFLVQEPSHNWLVISPSMSPENSPSVHPEISIAAGTTIDNQLVFELFSNVINANRILKMDSVFADSLRIARDRLPPMQVGRYGQLQEWLQDWDSPNDKNRHVSHLFGLYPSNQVSPYRTPALFAAAKKTLLMRGDISTGWSMGWKVNLWARLLDGNHAFKLIQNQLTPAGLNQGAQNSGGGTYPNLFDAHPPFQIDGNFGCTAGIAEMLLQSHDSYIFLLPALPDAWKNGRVSGLKTVGGFEITGMRWENGHLTQLKIRSWSGGNCRLRAYDKLQLKGKGKLRKATGNNPNPFFSVPQTAEPMVSEAATLTQYEPAHTFLYDLNTQPGKSYKLKVISR